MKLSWDDSGSRLFEAGLDRGVFYPKVGKGVSWNGLSKLTASTDNNGTSTIYIDGERKVNQLSLGDFSAVIEALTYPDEFIPYDGYAESKFSGQKRPMFGLSYRTLIGNDILGLERGYRLHLVYNCVVNPTGRENTSLNPSSDISTFSWNLSTTPLAFPYERPTSHLYLDSTLVVPAILTAIEDILYGTVSIEPRIPTIAEVLAIFEANAIYIIVDNGNGTFTATGPDEGIFASGTDLWTLDWPAVLELSSVMYRASSY